MSKFLIAFACVAGVILAGCGGNGDSSDGATATATSRRLPAGSPVTTAGIPTPDATEAAAGTEAAGSPTATQVVLFCDEIVPEASATPSEVQTLPLGQACVPDAGSDVRNEAGETAVEPLPGADIAAARIDSNGSILLISFFGNQEIPMQISEGTTISWIVEILVDGQAVYRLTTAQEPGNWDMVVTDLATSGTEKLRITSVYGNRIETPFRADMLPKLTGPFTYRAWSESTGPDGVVYYDWVPDAAGVNRDDPEAAIPFPQ